MVIVERVFTGRRKIEQLFIELRVLRSVLIVLNAKITKILMH